MPMPSALGNSALSLALPTQAESEAESAAIQVGTPSEADGSPRDEWQLASDSEPEGLSNSQSPRSPRSLESQSPRREGTASDAVAALAPVAEKQQEHDESSSSGESESQSGTDSEEEDRRIVSRSVKF